MTIMHESESTPARLTRRGFLAGLAAVGALAVVACASGTASPSGTTGSSTTPTVASGSAGTTPTAATGAATAANTVKMTDANKFEPASVTIAKGGSVTWTNTSTMPHSVTDDPAKASNKADAQLPSGAPAWDSSLLQPSQTYSHTFDVAGTYKYFCVPHEALGMLGTVIVQ